MPSRGRVVCSSLDQNSNGSCLLMVKARTCCLHGAESSAPRLDQHVLSEMCNHTSAHSLRHVCVCVVLAVPASAKLLFIFEKCNNCASGKLLFIFDKCNNCASGKLLFISDKCNNCASVKLLLALPRVGTSPCWHFPAPRVGKSPCFHGTQHQKPTSPRKTPPATPRVGTSPCWCWQPPCWHLPVSLVVARLASARFSSGHLVDFHHGPPFFMVDH